MGFREQRLHLTLIPEHLGGLGGWVEVSGLEGSESIEEGELWIGGLSSHRHTLFIESA